MEHDGNRIRNSIPASYSKSSCIKRTNNSIWEEENTSSLSPIIDFVFKDTNEIWGSDDDTDIEYIYQYLLYTLNTTFLTPNQIREGWLKHIKPAEENYLWVSNQKAYEKLD